jgi:hypothetical protein
MGSPDPYFVSRIGVGKNQVFKIFFKILHPFDGKGIHPFQNAYSQSASLKKIKTLRRTFS